MPSNNENLDDFNVNFDEGFMNKINEEFDKMIDMILKNLDYGKMVKKERISNGFNSLIFDVFTSKDSNFIVKVTTPDFFNSRKTLNEIVALNFIRNNVNDFPIPKVVFAVVDTENSETNYCCDDSVDLKLIHDIKSPFEFIMMEKIKGTPLNRIWNSLSWEERKVYIIQITEYIIKLKEYKFNSVGNFLNHEYEISNFVNSLEIEGPFNSYKEIVRNRTGNLKSYIQTNIDKCEDNEIKNKMIDYFTEIKSNYIPLFDSLVDKHINRFEDTDDFCFTHGDLAPKNIIVNVEKKIVTGIIDFEWSGSCMIDTDIEEMEYEPEGFVDSNDLSHKEQCNFIHQLYIQKGFDLSSFFDRKNNINPFYEILRKIDDYFELFIHNENNDDVNNSSINNTSNENFFSFEDKCNDFTLEFKEFFKNRIN